MVNVQPLAEGDPRRVGDYDVTARLGEGGQGVVFLGRGSTGPVAVKVLHAQLIEDEQARARFVREVEVTKRVARFCTAQVLSAGLASGRPYIVSEYVPGPSLHHQLREEGPRRGSALDRLALNTATALAAIHGAGVVHRDFKPGNVLMGPDGPVVIDFGIARALDASGTMPGAVSQVVGTPAFMAPEQLADGVIGPPTDMFAWAVTMAYAATGVPAFGHRSIPGVIHRILNEEPDLRELDTNLHPIVAACLSKDPSQRPTARQLMDELMGHNGPPTANPDDAPLGGTGMPGAAGAPGSAGMSGDGAVTGGAGVAGGASSGGAAAPGGGGVPGGVAGGVGMAGGALPSAAESPGGVAVPGSAGTPGGGDVPSGAGAAGRPLPDDVGVPGSAGMSGGGGVPSDSGAAGGARPDGIGVSGGAGAPGGMGVPDSAGMPGDVGMPGGAAAADRAMVTEHPATVFPVTAPWFDAPATPDSPQDTEAKTTHLSAESAAAAALPAGATAYSPAGDRSSSVGVASPGTAEHGTMRLSTAGTAYPSGTGAPGGMGPGMTDNPGTMPEPPERRKGRMILIAGAVAAAAIVLIAGIGALASSRDPGTDQPGAAPTTPAKRLRPPFKRRAPLRTRAAAPRAPGANRPAKKNPYTPQRLCGGGYRVVGAHPVGEARIYLLYNTRAGVNCVVTLVPKSTGKLPLTASLVVQGGDRQSRSVASPYFAGPVRLPAKGKCVMWGGAARTASWVSAWSHCGM